MPDLKRPKLVSEFGLAGPATGQRPAPRDPGTANRKPSRRYRRFEHGSDTAQQQTHEERIVRAIGGES